MEIKVQEKEVADGLAETEQGMVASCPVTAEYALLGIFTKGKPAIHFRVSSYHVKIFW